MEFDFDDLITGNSTYLPKDIPESYPDQDFWEDIVIKAEIHILTLDDLNKMQPRKDTDPIETMFQLHAILRTDMQRQEKIAGCAYFLFTKFDRI